MTGLEKHSKDTSKKAYTLSFAYQTYVKIRNAGLLTAKPVLKCFSDIIYRSRYPGHSVRFNQSFVRLSQNV